LVIEVGVLVSGGTGMGRDEIRSWDPKLGLCTSLLGNNLHTSAGYAELCWKHVMGLSRAGGANHSSFRITFLGYNA